MSLHTCMYEMCVMCSQNNLRAQQAAHQLLCKVRIYHDGEGVWVAWDGWVVNKEGAPFASLHDKQDMLQEDRGSTSMPFE